MFRKLTPAMIATVVAAGLVCAGPHQAEARGGRIAGGIVAGLIAGTLLGAYAYGAPRYRYHYRHRYVSDYGCYRGPRRCGWVGRHCHRTRWGRRICHRGSYRCWRRTYCD